MDAAAAAHGGRIPVTVIGGFLGSGKTTLLNRLLQQAGGRRLAVLVNDFGAINVDAALVASRSAEVISLSNGCVCCSIGGDLGDALIALLQRSPAPEAIVIEASGVADPWRIAQVGLADPMLALDGVLVMVDAAAVQEQAADPLLADTVERQLRGADLLVVNHCDRVDEAALAGLRAWLDRLLPATPRFETRFAAVPASLMGAGPAVPVESTVPAVPTVPTVPAVPAVPAAPTVPAPAAPVAASGTRPLRGVQADPEHERLFDTWSLTVREDFDAGALRGLLRSMPRGVIRLKGLVRTGRGWSVLQFAGRHGSLRDWAAGSAAPPLMQPGFVVAIGARGELPVAALEAALHSARLEPQDKQETSP